ncbi:hypothetical protein V6N12_022233 [Hibiscus sabdariffa]|uniref:Uncharacterized protein n=1 Tax=Hibiscus sabdariffa TaxID=183260 RepID=A0ABR2FU27_9ROSI
MPRQGKHRESYKKKRIYKPKTRASSTIWSGGSIIIWAALKFALRSLAANAASLVQTIGGLTFLSLLSGLRYSTSRSSSRPPCFRHLFGKQKLD